MSHKTSDGTLMLLMYFSGPLTGHALREAVNREVAEGKTLQSIYGSLGRLIRDGMVKRIEPVAPNEPARFDLTLIGNQVIDAIHDATKREAI